VKTIAVMPIKLNNLRLPGKNIRLLGGKPLLQYALCELLQVHEINRTFVFCSDDTICEYLPKNIEFLRRPAYLDSQETNFTQIFDVFLSQVEADCYVYMHATAPFVRADTMKECVTAVHSGQYDSAFTAVRIQDYLWQDGMPLNFDATNIPRSQDLKSIYRETSGVYVFTKQVFSILKRRVGMRPFIKEVFFRESIDINTIDDFRLAEQLLETKNL
jgi:CMP-N-acetylneuraminic acid synthetase